MDELSTEFRKKSNRLSGLTEGLQRHASALNEIKTMSFLQNKSELVELAKLTELVERRLVNA